MTDIVIFCGDRNWKDMLLAALYSGHLLKIVAFRKDIANSKVTRHGVPVELYTE